MSWHGQDCCDGLSTLAVDDGQDCCDGLAALWQLMVDKLVSGLTEIVTVLGKEIRYVWCHSPVLYYCCFCHWVKKEDISVGECEWRRGSLLQGGRRIQEKGTMDSQVMSLKIWVVSFIKLNKGHLTKALYLAVKKKE